MTVGADNKGAMGETVSHTTVLPAESLPGRPEATEASEASEPTGRPEVTEPVGQGEAPDLQGKGAVTALLALTRGAPLERRRFLGVSRLIGAVVGTGLATAVFIGVAVVALLLAMRMLVDA